MTASTRATSTKPGRADDGLRRGTGAIENAIMDHVQFLEVVRCCSTGAPGASARLSHVREHEILEAERLDRPGRVEDRAVAAHEQRALPVGVALLDDVLVARERGRCRAAAR